MPCTRANACDELTPTQQPYANNCGTGILPEKPPYKKTVGKEKPKNKKGRKICLFYFFMSLLRGN